MSKKYKEYSLDQFITDDDFIKWVKYPDEVTDNFWQSFIKNTPDKEIIIKKAKLAILQLTIVAKENAPADEITQIWMEIEDDLKPKNPTMLSIDFNWKRWTAAASILLVLGFAFWWKDKTVSIDTDVYSALKSKTAKQLEEIINNSASKLSVNLPDGSMAILEPNSRLSYNKSFKGSIREVYLAGEAFFDVQKNPKKPFMVYANGLVTKVLGTSFSIRAFEKDSEVTVQVKTGKVSVFANNNVRNHDPEINGVVLTPNQKVVFGTEEERFTRTLVAKPTLLLSNEEIQQFSFRDSPVDKIFEALEKGYGVKINYDKEIVKNCHLTTSLTNENLFEKLDIICTGIEASYKVVDAQVIITSNGCN